MNFFMFCFIIYLTFTYFRHALTQSTRIGDSAFDIDCRINIQGVKKVPDPKQNYIGLMTEG